MSVCGIIITYNPQLATFRQLVVASQAQVSELVVVDNGSDESLLAGVRLIVTEAGVTLVELGQNFGVAAAQNKGVCWAKDHRHHYILILDQDSIPDANMVSRLLAAWTSLKQKGVSLAGVGPCLIDSRTGKRTWFVSIHWHGIVRKGYKDKPPEQVVATDFLVSSGLLTSLDVLDQVGLLEEGLFVDNVDMEWCFRARAQGLSLYGVCDATMSHSIGDQVFVLGPFVLHRHSPIRQYYIMRNRLILYRRRYAPVGWVIQDLFRALFKTVVFSLIIPPRREHIQMIYRGIRDALSGKLGPYSD